MTQDHRNPSPYPIPHTPYPRWRPILLQSYRLGIIVCVALLLRQHTLRQRIGGDAPIKLSEVQRFYENATRLIPDAERFGFVVGGTGGKREGYVVRTMPISDQCTGYNGPTDVLICFDAGMRVIGCKIRSSADTYHYVDDLASDPTFLKTWNGKSWDELSKWNRQKAGFDGLSGATVTSLAIADAIVYRLAHASPDAGKAVPLKLRAHDYALGAFVLAAVLLAFTPLRTSKWLRRVWLAILIAAGLYSGGDLLALPLLRSWATGGLVWRSAPGLAVLTAAALLIPWLARRPLYCSYLCPHGAAQELVSVFGPKWLHLNLPASVSKGLRWIPGLLLCGGLVLFYLSMPQELATLEPFAAYNLKVASTFVIAFAIVSVLLAAILPRGYCKYGCPTGALLEFVRGQDRTDHFGRRDVAAAMLLGIAWLLYRYAEPIGVWMAGG
ncbi:MAG TPA: 4Fe-4S binding protein [Planctomycetota bacterium]|jgi:hypothetical protein